MASPFATVAGRPFTLAGALAMLFATSTAGQAPPPPTQTADMPTTGMVGWWDASALSWGQTYNTIADKSGASGPALSTGGAKAVPRLAGSLGGAYAEGNYFMSPFNMAYMHPLIVDHAYTASSVPVGAGGAFTVFLVWSRANQYQPQPGTGTSVQAVPLIAIGGATVLSMSGNGDGADTLTFVPPGGSSQTAGTLELRHTHSARLVFSGSTVDLWLDGAAVITGAACTQLGATANLTFLSAAQCIFHEAAAWSHAPNDTEHADLTGYANRYPLGARRAINGVLIGQSNAAKMGGSGNNYTVAKKVAYLTGCISSNLLMKSGSYGQISGADQTIYSGQGLYDMAPASNLRFLDSTPGGDPSTWPLGSNGTAFMAALDAMNADQRASLRYVAWFWSESDCSVLTYANKPTYVAAMKRAFSLIRAHLSATAATLPVLIINALPFTTDVGSQAHREVMADLVSTAGLNVHFMLAQADDAIGEGDTWDSATGLESGSGNGAHRDDAGELMYARRFGIPIARAALAANAAAGTYDAVTAIDSSIPQLGGPSIASAHYEGGTSILVTVTHDGGTDLAVPLRAALGVGWTLMDGVSDTVAGNPGAPGALIAATACARVSATQLRITLANAPSHPAKAQLYYVYGSGLDSNSYAVIGQGNAVTDNFASMPLPAGWQIGADLGSAEQFNNALQATTYGVPLT